MFISFYCTHCGSKEIVEIWEHRQHLYRPYCSRCNHRMSIVLSKLNEKDLEEGLANDCRM